MTDLTVFKNETFGEIRTLEIDKEPWFVGKDVAAALGYGNSRDALARYIDDDDKRLSKVATIGGVQDLIVINTSGVYSLIFYSKTLNAKIFKRWLTIKVLPELRSNYVYDVNEMINNPDLVINALIDLKAERIKQKEEKQKTNQKCIVSSNNKKIYNTNAKFTFFSNNEFNKIKQIEKERSNDYMGFIYVVEWGDMVKIGCTSFPYKRLMVLKNQAEKYGNISLGRIALSPEHTNYKENERKIHRLFDKNREQNTELFNATIQEVVTKICGCIEYVDESDTIEKEINNTCNIFKNLFLNLHK